MDIVTRLIAFKNWTNLTSSQFADKARIPRPTLSQFLNGRNKRLSDDLISKLHTAFPELNVLWLLFGQGEMLTSENAELSEGKNDGFSGDLFSQTTEQQAVDDEDFAQNFVEDFEQSSVLSDSGEKSVQNSSTGVMTRHQNQSVKTQQSLAAQNQRVVNSVQSATEPTAPAQTSVNEISAQSLIAEAMAMTGQGTGIPCKRIKYITVFYDDNSYEVFARPGQAPQ